MKETMCELHNGNIIGSFYRPIKYSEFLSVLLVAQCCNNVLDDLGIWKILFLNFSFVTRNLIVSMNMLTTKI